MIDVILFLFVFIIGYLCFMSIVLFMIKMFFPFFTKEELEKRNSVIMLK